MDSFRSAGWAVIIAYILAVSSGAFVAVAGPTSESDLEQFMADEAGPFSSNYYERLGTTESASQSDLKLHFYESVKKFHPDLYATTPKYVQTLATEAMRNVNQAWETLKDPQKRIHYRPQSGSQLTAKDLEVLKAQKEGDIERLIYLVFSGGDDNGRINFASNPALRRKAMSTLIQAYDGFDEKVDSIWLGTSRAFQRDSKYPKERMTLNFLHRQIMATFGAEFETRNAVPSMRVPHFVGTHRGNPFFYLLVDCLDRVKDTKPAAKEVLIRALESECNYNPQAGGGLPDDLQFKYLLTTLKNEKNNPRLIAALGTAVSNANQFRWSYEDYLAVIDALAERIDEPGAVDHLVSAIKILPNTHSVPANAQKVYLGINAKEGFISHMAFFPPAGTPVDHAVLPLRVLANRKNDPKIIEALGFMASHAELYKEDAGSFRAMVNSLMERKSEAGAIDHLLAAATRSHKGSIIDEHASYVFERLANERSPKIDSTMVALAKRINSSRAPKTSAVLAEVLRDRVDAKTYVKLSSKLSKTHSCVIRKVLNLIMGSK